MQTIKRTRYPNRTSYEYSFGMNPNEIENLLGGGDLRSIGRSNLLVSKIHTQEEFDELFPFLFHSQRLIIMRAADVIEKITIRHPRFLDSHKKELFKLIRKATDKELKWHLALIIPRVTLNKTEIDNVWKILSDWVTEKSNSRIVRANALQALFELTIHHTKFRNELIQLFNQLEKEKIPSINARIKKMRKQNE